MTRSLADVIECHHVWAYADSGYNCNAHGERHLVRVSFLFSSLTGSRFCVFPTALEEGGVMANEKNLKPIKKGQLSKEEAKKRGAAGARKREEKKAKERIFAESIKQMLTDDDWREIILNAIERAKDSDKAFEVIRDTLGQKPKDQVALETEIPFSIEIKTIE